jgi:hypothetical protein
VPFPHAPAHDVGLLAQSPLDRVELETHLLQIGKSPRRVLLHGPFHDRGQVRGDGRIERGEGWWAFRSQLMEDLHRILAGQRRSKAQQFIEHGSGREDVRSMIGAPLHLLRRDVAQRPHDQAGAREAPFGGGEAGDAEVEDLHLSGAQQENVAGLDIPVHDSHLVGVVEAVAHLGHDRDLVLEGHGGSIRDQPPQLLPVEQLHDDEEPPIVLAHVVDRDDVGVAEPRARLGLAEEAGA